MRFTELISAAGLCPQGRRGDAEVRDVQCDSRRCGAGSCFVAVRGWRDDGHKYIPQALAAGAAAVVCRDDSAVPPAAACAVMDDPRRGLGPLAQAIRGWPCRRLVNVAVTGTKGKSTTAILIRAVLEAAGVRAGLLGTIAYQIGGRSLPAPTTTPDAVALAELTDQMVRGGCTHLVMEASSHALDQGRTEGVEFRSAVFTNLSGDHMDYHGDMERYFAAKRRLFEELPPAAAAVINGDDARSAALARSTRASVVRFGLGAGADFRGRIARAGADGSELVVDCPGGPVELRTPLMGRHNAYNCLAALAAGAALGVSPTLAAAAIAKVGRIPGRMERVPGEAPYQVFVDYSHTDDALENVLRTLREVRGQGRVIVVFGCGGDRDRTKRPRMARVAEALADRIVVTSDNPRSEDPRAIIDEILTGFSPGALPRTAVQADRRKAIELALAQAAPGDVVLIAGKGHETYQILGARRVHFDDVQVAGELMRQGARP